MSYKRDLEDEQDGHGVQFIQRKKVCYPLVACISCVALAVIITLAVLYSLALDKDTTNGVQKPGKKYVICNDDRCFALGKEIVHNMNLSVDPCKDFYAYACGGWQQRHPLKHNQSKTGPLTIQGIKNIQIMFKAFQKAPLNYSKNEAVMKTVRFYNSCVNTSSNAPQSLQQLVRLIAKYGGWSVFGNYDNKVTIATRIGRTTVDLGICSLFAALPGQDKYNSSYNVLWMRPAALTLPSPGLYLNSSTRVLVEKVARTLAALLGRKSSYSRLMEIYDFEVKLAKIASGKTAEAELEEFVDKSIREKTPLEDFRITINDFCKKTELSCSDFKSILRIFYHGKTFSGSEKILVTNVIYYKNLYSLYKQTDESLVGDYIMWQVVWGYLIYLSPSFASFLRPWLIQPSCSVLALQSFPMPFSLLYVNANYDDASQGKVKEMTEDIRTSFIDRLSSDQSWMDSGTRERAKQKALAIKAYIGYPPYIKDPEKLAAKYKSLIVTDNFFRNMISMNHFKIMNQLNSYGKPVNKAKWSLPPYEVNAQYDPTANKITLLAGILQSPFFNPDYPRYMQYGAIGMVIGHEITHGFDGSGRKYDKYGNYNNWWSDSADAKFKQKSSCLVKQYNKYKVFGMKINGTFTLNENIADNGGIKIAYDAYRRWAARNGTEKILPGLELNPDQLFFVGFAQTWCSVFSKKGAFRQITTDSHSNPKYRVIGSLSNFDKFSQAFKCPLKSRMNPFPKCGVW